MKTTLFAWFAIIGWIFPVTAQKLPQGFSIKQGALNSASLNRNGKQLIVYGAESKKGAESVLLTHVRRDLAIFASQAGNAVIAPESSVELLKNPQAHWDAWWNDRFNYYGQQVTKLPVRALTVKRTVKDGDEIDWEGLKIRILAIPGYTRDMVAYVTEIGGKRIAFTGDLIWDGGRVFDIYSFQDAIPEAKIGSYHGHGARFAPWIASLRKIAAEKPDLIVPLRGPVLTNPQRDLKLAEERIQAIYKNYLSTNALHWYFGAERLTIAGRRVFGDETEVKLMPFAKHIDLPDWCRHIGTTKLLVAKDKSGFVLDVGGKRALDSLQQFLKDGLVESIDGIWVTHTHNDHSAYVRDARDTFGCPVYATAEVADVLLYPERWFLPGVSPNAVKRVHTLKEGETLNWKEFKLTGYFYPGQMYNHGALLVEKPGHEPVFFIGDSFSPSGIDDYCLMNRNLMGEDTGYLYCLDKVRQLPKNTWLVNQHIPHLFRFSDSELNYLETRYRERRRLLAQLLPWDHVDYGVDEQWAWFYPYGVEAKTGETIELTLKLRNHSPHERTFFPTFHFHGKVVGRDSVVIPARSEARAKLTLPLAHSLKPGVHLVTASIFSREIDLKHWCEALVKIGE